MLSFEQKLQNYAELAVKLGVGLQAGQQLMVRAPLEAAPLVRLIAKSAYQTGATLVDVLWHDDALTLTRFKHAPRDSFETFPAWRTEALTRIGKEGGAVLSIYAADPDLLKGQDPELIAIDQRVGNEHMLPYRKMAMRDEVNWSIISLPIRSWAAKVFPNETPEAQIAKLWEAIFTVCRVDQPDPQAAWQDHLSQLIARQGYLNQKQYTALKYRAPGTDLTLGLPQNHVWQGGQAQTHTNITFVPNVPTEEVFTMPHKDKAEGVISSTRPLSYGGVLIDNFSLTFSEGRVVKVTAEKGKETLQKLVDSDEGAARLGEVALVPNSSPVSQTGLLFFNTLFDENASSHLALGRAYRFSLENGKQMSDEAFGAAGGNNSLVHVDFMVGSKEMDIDGVTQSGQTEPVMRAGEWAF